MEKLIYLWNGYIRIRVEGEQTERFLNLCKGKKICIKKLCRHPNGELTGILAIKDFFLLGPIHRKTGVRIHIIEKHGLPFFFFRSKKRKAFFLGILLCIALLFFLSGHIWNIHVEGNHYRSTGEILDFLENRFSQVGQSLAKAHNQEERRRISNLCFEILQYLAAPPPELLYPPALTKVLGLIDSDYGRPLSIADFTAAGGVSESGLARLFRRYLHTTPYRYLTSHRMRQAEMMLLQGVLSVKEIAARVGYDNPLNFSTEFKKFFGSSPRNFHR